MNGPDWLLGWGANENMQKTELIIGILGIQMLRSAAAVGMSHHQS